MHQSEEGEQMETEQRKKEPPKILIVDDISINVKILENIMQEEGYETLCALSVQEALDIMKETMPQVILSDFSMPGIDGVEFCRLLKNNPRTRDIPFIFITVVDSGEEKREAFMAGAVDFIRKPIEPIEVVMRVRNQLNSYRIKQEMENYNRMMHAMVSDQKRQTQMEQENVLLALAKIVERRNFHIANHLEKVGNNSRILAQSIQLLPQYENLITDKFIETIEMASKLHNIGKIIVPDATGADAKKDDAERIRIHAEEGANLLEEINSGGCSSRFLDMAILIARYHHANWDGSGYPQGVAGEGIPLAARITAIVNDFDSLVSNRHAEGEEKLSIEDGVRIINERSGTAYDPRIVAVFNKVLKRLRTD